MLTKIFALALVVLGSLTNVAAQTMRVATYNVRFDNKQDTADTWLKRVPYLTGLVKFQDFDLFGTQEVLHNQLQDMSARLPDYDHIGVGRNDGKQSGEFSAIFYKKDKFTLLKQGTFWLAPDPSVPGKGWDAAMPRICTWGEFREKATGFTFYLFNTHFDHRGLEARRESAKLILAKIKELAGPAPAIFTGDLNVNQRDESYALFTNSGLVQDAYSTAKLVYAPNGTFNGFNALYKNDARIDHIFLSPAFTPIRYGILTDTYNGGKMPSDHYPVAVEVRYSVKK